MSQIEFTDEIIIRTPLLADDTNLSKESILDLFFNNQLVNTSIYLTSPSLHQKITRFSDNPNEIDDKTLGPLYKFVARMSTRCTPYGIFAAVNVSHWNQTQIKSLTTQGAFKPRVRMDMGSLAQIMSNYNEEVKPGIKYYLNNTGHINGDKFYFLRYKTTKGRRFHRVQSADVDFYLSKIIEGSQNGIDLEGFILLLKSFDDELTAEEITSFFSELVKAQILISELEPNVTGEYYLDRVLRLNLFSDKKHPLKRLHQNLSNLNHSAKLSTETLKKHYEFATEHYKEMASSKDFYQIDTSKVFIQDDKFTEHKLRESLTEAFQFLFAHKNEGVDLDSTLERFKKKFRERYEGKLVPMSEAIDSESGIGYPVGPSKVEQSLLERIEVKSTSPQQGIKINLNRLQLAIHKKLLDEPDLKTLDLSTLKIETPISTKKYLPSMFSAMVSFVKADKVILKTLGRSSGIDLLTRFADVDEDLNSIVENLASKENEIYSANNFIIAELCHLPSDRLGNILIRPSVRPYEIPYLSISTKEHSKHILIKDLFLYIDAQSDTLKVYSKKLGKHIHITHSNAYNTSQTKNPAFRLLCDLQNQYRPLVGFSIGGLNSIYRHLPRITYKNVILHRESYSVPKEHLEKTVQMSLSEFKGWCKSKKLPTKLLLKESDNELFFDLDNPIALRVFKEEIKKKRSIQITEFLESDSQFTPKLENSKSKYAHEYILPFIYTPNQSQIYRTTAINKDRILTGVRSKSSFLGDEWTYMKIYCGKNIANTILRKINSCLSKEFWFFIKYGDELGHHLRLRFKTKTTEHKDQISSQIYDLMKPYYLNGFISKMMLDNYDPEIHRYGQETMNQCEELFVLDSKYIMMVLSALDHEVSEKELHLIGFLSLDRYFDDLGYSLEQKVEFTTKSKTNYGFEYGLNEKNVRLSFNRKYRTLRPQLDEVYGANGQTNKYQLLMKYSRNAPMKLKPFFLKLKQQNNHSILTSVLHMHFNRLFISDQRLLEFVVYYMANKHYISMLARENKGMSSKT